ncbi:MAG: methyltransferase domain-containing protein [Myxococcota bacterium]
MVLLVAAVYVGYRVAYFLRGLTMLSGLAEDVGDFYGKVFDRNWSQVLARRPEDEGWCSVGLWPAPDGYGQACGQLVDRMLEQCRMDQVQHLLDVGCGRGNSTQRIASAYPHINIVGIDVTPEHVAIARERFRGRQEAVEFVNADATDLSMVADSSQDIVFALECAFHFDTRKKFLREALRVLRPGGRAVLADICSERRSRALHKKAWPAIAAIANRISRGLGVPVANIMDIDEYREMVASLGFSETSVVDINADTSEPFSRHALHCLKESDAVGHALDPRFRAYAEHNWHYILPRSSRYLLVALTK